MSSPQPYDAVLGNTKPEAQKALEAAIYCAWHSQDEAYKESWKAIRKLDFNRSNDLGTKFNQTVAYSRGLMDSYKIIYGEAALNRLMRQHRRVWSWDYTKPE